MWASFLYERYASLRPLNQVSAWLSGLGLPIAAGTLAGSVERFIPMFEPVADAILAHQNQQAVRHGDETGWRIQSLREIGRSNRAWLWNSVSEDAVYFHCDPSRSAEAAKTLFGDTAVVVFVVCDRLSSYKKMARDLDGKVILCFCWVHQRRDFIQCAAGHNRLTDWCQSWIERIASIYSLNKARLKHVRPRSGAPDATVRRRAGRTEEGRRQAVRGRRSGAGPACRPDRARPSRCARCSTTAKG